jgi:hypothetical protein
MVPKLEDQILQKRDLLLDRLFPSFFLYGAFCI